MKKLGVVVVAVLCIAVPASSSAAPDSVGSTALGVRGAIGCGLLAGEITLTIEAAAGVRNPWLLSIIPIVVAGGGAAGGYFLEQESVEAGVAMLAAGATLLVPSILLTLVLTSETYEDLPEGTTVTTERGGGPATPLSMSWAPPALVNLSPDGTRLSVPTILVAEAPARSLWAAAGSSGYEYRLSLFRWAF